MKTKINEEKNKWIIIIIIKKNFINCYNGSQLHEEKKGKKENKLIISKLVRNK